MSEWNYRRHRYCRFFIECRIMVDRGAHIQAFTFSCQDHGRLPDEYISKHSRWNSQEHGRLPAVHISKHSPYSWCWNSQDHGRLPAVHISKHSSGWCVCCERDKVCVELSNEIIDPVDLIVLVGLFSTDSAPGYKAVTLRSYAGLDNDLSLSCCPS